MQEQLFQKFPVTSHTKYVTQGSTFVAVKGMKEDGVAYIESAIAAGATAVVVEHGAQLEEVVAATLVEKQIAVTRVENARLALAQLSAQAHAYPAQKLTIIGVTGTKGKSTTAFLLEHILRGAGHKTALLSTIHNKILDEVYTTELTTQHPDYIHAFLRACVERGVTHVIMEVAAQALSLHRVATIMFDAVLFLNFSYEHGEFYATQQEYFAAKALLFSQLKPKGHAIVPVHDERIDMAARHAVANRVQSFPMVLQENEQLAGISFIHEDVQFNCEALVGNFNIENVCAALTCVRNFGVSLESAQKALQTFAAVPGRLNKYTLPNGAVAFIDYAHNPASFEQVLKTMRPATKNLIVVFGAGGDRAAEKRPVMGALASEYADVIILTTDNPRSEEPETIIADIRKGISHTTCAKVVIEPDRERAIRFAYKCSDKDAIILLLGKGPDEYQLVKGVKTHFSEREILQSL